MAGKKPDTAYENDPTCHWRKLSRSEGKEGKISLGKIHLLSTYMTYLREAGTLEKF